MKVIGYVLFGLIALLLGFFGLGPVLFADGSFSERMTVLFFVLVCYLFWGFFLKLWMNKQSRKGNKGKRQG